MRKFAENDQAFKNTVNYYLGQRLATHSIDEVEEVGLSRWDRNKIHAVFRECMDKGDITEVTTQEVEFNELDGWDEFMEGCRKRANDAIDAEIENQILILRSDHGE